jgi:hypothetical protein
LAASGNRLYKNVFSDHWSAECTSPTVGNIFNLKRAL